MMDGVCACCAEELEGDEVFAGDPAGVVYVPMTVSAFGNRVFVLSFVLVKLPAGTMIVTVPLIPVGIGKEYAYVPALTGVRDEDM
jgi:hypothetical protein